MLHPTALDLPEFTLDPAGSSAMVLPGFPSGAGRFLAAPATVPGVGFQLRTLGFRAGMFLAGRVPGPAGGHLFRRSFLPGRIGTRAAR